MQLEQGSTGMASSPQSFEIIHFLFRSSTEKTPDFDSDSRFGVSIVLFASKSAHSPSSSMVRHRRWLASDWLPGGCSLAFSCSSQEDSFSAGLNGTSLHGEYYLACCLVYPWSAKLYFLSCWYGDIGIKVGCDFLSEPHLPASLGCMRTWLSFKADNWMDLFWSLV